jgi:hypothetical protein
MLPSCSMSSAVMAEMPNSLHTSLIPFLTSSNPGWALSIAILTNAVFGRYTLVPAVAA